MKRNRLRERLRDFEEDGDYFIFSSSKTWEYRIVRGLPSAVEKEVQELIQQGFVLNGELMKYEPPGDSVQILVQGMVKYDKASEVS